jgi:nitronate monooxygenase
MSIQQLLGIELPIIQAPMAGVQNSTLAIAVSNAGGLGSLPCALLSAEALRCELETIRTSTIKPVNLNFFCHQQPAENSEIIDAWHDLLKGYYEELGIESSSSAAEVTRMPFNQEMAEIVCDFKPTVVSFHFGLPSQELLDMVRGSGAKILSSATTLEEALWLEAHGVDGVIAQGFEAGGHRGMFLTEEIDTQVGIFALLPQLAQAVKVPVIAAGGIANAKGVRAALALGAAGVQVGTAYLLCPEAITSAVHRAALKSNAAYTTALTNLFTGRPARGIVNRFMRELGPMNEQVPRFPLAAMALASLRAQAESMGNSDFSPLWAGQNPTGCKEIPAAILTCQLAEAN